jgi:hypothetical protein
VTIVDDVAALVAALRRAPASQGEDCVPGMALMLEVEVLCGPW